MIFRRTRMGSGNFISFGVGILFIGFFVLDKISLWLLIPYFVFFIIGTGIVIADAFQQQIIIKQQGIEYSGVGFSVELEWGKITDIDTDLLLFGNEGLYIKKSNLISKFRYFNFKPYIGMKFRKDFFLPLTPFQKDWRDNELGQQIKQYAPHLFQDDNQEKL